MSPTHAHTPPKPKPVVIKPDDVKSIKPPSLMAGENRHLKGMGDIGIDQLKLRGQPWRAKIGAAVLDGPVERSIDQASTVGVKLLDPAGKVRNHPILLEEFSVELDDLWFAYVGASKAEDGLTINFEDEAINRLRQLKGPVKAYRDQVTRAEFIAALIAAVPGDPIPAWIPELHVTQPIAKGQTPKQPPKAAGNEPTPANASKATGQGIRGTVTPVQVGQAMLAAGFPADPTVIATGIAIVNCECGFNGNLVNPTYGAAGFWGEIPIFQQQYHCPSPSCTGDLLLSTKAAFASYKVSKWDAWCKFEGGLTATCPGCSHVSEHLSAAKQAIKAGGGSIQAGASSSGTKTVTKRYAFEVRDGEDYWHAITRLAGEVNWRAFVSNGIFYYADEPTLLNCRVEVEAGTGQQGCDSVTWEFDTGKPVTELTVSGRGRQWVAPPGTVVNVVNEGPANGRYLVSDIQGNLLNPAITITLKRATQPLNEPAAQTTTKSTKGAGSGNLAGATGKGAALVKWAHTQLGTRSGAKYGCGSASWCGCFIAYGLEHACGIKVPFAGAWAPNYTCSGWGTKVPSIHEAHPGDICTWQWSGTGTACCNCAGRPDHVNIYMGNNQWIGGNQDSSDCTIDAPSLSDLVAIVRPPGF